MKPWEKLSLKNDDQDPPENMETAMQKISLGVSLLSLGLMIAGITLFLLRGNFVAVPGTSVLPASDFIHPLQYRTTMLIMSAGIILLALLPALRVLMALSLYIRSRVLINILAALIVLIELILSMRTG
jgi:hypothetical protein